MPVMGGIRGASFLVQWRITETPPMGLMVKAALHIKRSTGDSQIHHCAILLEPLFSLAVIRQDLAASFHNTPVCSRNWERPRSGPAMAHLFSDSSPA
jgi:hypothetical protein